MTNQCTHVFLSGKNKDAQCPKNKTKGHDKYCARHSKFFEELEKIKDSLKKNKQKPKCKMMKCTHKALENTKWCKLHKQKINEVKQKITDLDKINLSISLIFND